VAALGGSATQTINIGPGGSITITSGSGTGTTQFLTTTGTGCSNCVSADGASLNSLGTQTINFASGGSATPTLTLTGGLGGVGNSATLTATNGQTITGRPNIFLYGGTAGSSSQPSPGADLSNGAIIANSAGNQNISAASVRMEGRGDASTAGGAIITAPVQTLDVSGDVALLGGASSESVRGASAAINGNSLTLKLGGNLTLTAGSHSAAAIGSPAQGASTRATITGNVTTSDTPGAIADFAWNDAIVTVNGNYTANGGLLAHGYNNSSAFNLLAGGNILFSGISMLNGGAGAYNLTAGSTTALPPQSNRVLGATGTIVEQNSNVTTSGGMNWQASQGIQILGGNGSSLSSRIEGGNQVFTAPSITLQGGDGGNNSFVRLISRANQTINTTNLLIRGGGDSGAFANNLAELSVNGGGVQKINIGAGGSLNITAGSGSGLGPYIDGSGATLCNNCTAADWARLRSGGTQFINFAGGGTFTLTGGKAGIGNHAAALSRNGQTISGQPIISLFGGTGGGGTIVTESDGTQVPLWNLAGIVNTDSGLQQISAASITLAGLGDANTAGGAFNASQQQSITVTGNVKLQGGASNQSGSSITLRGTPGILNGGSAVALFGNALALNVGGDLALIGGTGSSSPAILGNPAGGTAQINVAGNFTRSGNVLLTPANSAGGTPVSPTTTPSPTPTTPPLATTTATTNQVTADTVTRATETTPTTAQAAEAAFAPATHSSNLSVATVAAAESAPAPSSSQASSIQQQDTKPASTGKPNMEALAAMISQRHQQRTELYQKALEELRQNPAAADVPDCKTGGPQDSCIRTDTQKLTLAATTTVPITRKRIALLFGNNNYADKRMAHLNTPIADVQSVAEVLRSKFGFETHVVTNATKADFFREMNQLAGNVDNSDSVFVMYAGHGYEIKENKTGFWIPTDAKTDAPQNWISNNDIGRFLKAIPARQVMLVSDSCFSGSLTREQNISEMKKQERSNILRQRSVTALSSGGDEPVLDSGAGGHSVFAAQLLNSLGKLKKDATGFELYRGVYNAVLQEFPQSPQYGGVLSAGHSGAGDYLIDLNKAKAR